MQHVNKEIIYDAQRLLLSLCLVGVRSIMMKVSVCLSVCLSVRSHILWTTRPNFIEFHVACGRGRCLCPPFGGVAIRYVLPVFWIISHNGALWHRQRMEDVWSK